MYLLLLARAGGVGIYLEAKCQFCPQASELEEGFKTPEKQICENNKSLKNQGLVFQPTL